MAVVGDTPWALEQAAFAAIQARQTKILTRADGLHGDARMLQEVGRLRHTPYLLSFSANRLERNELDHLATPRHHYKSRKASKE